jgi:hypothetical protein
MRVADSIAAALLCALLSWSCSKPAEQAPVKAEHASNSDGARRASSTSAGADKPKLINVNEDVRVEGSGLKVVGGHPVPAGAMLAVVGVTYGADRQPGCTGNLIESDIVLTAAHCLCGDMQNPNTRVSNVFVGNNWATRTGPKAGLYYQVTAFRSAIPWPKNMTDAQCRGLKVGRDLALLKLKAPVKNVAPIKLAPDAVTAGALSYRVAGFGAIDEQAEVYPNEKYHARVAGVSNACRGNVGAPSDEAYYGCLPGEEIVAGNRRAPDSCNGDSGGPLLVTANKDGGVSAQDAFYLAGVTSRPVNDAPEYCGYGGIYERLTPSARRWISDTIKAMRAGK